MNMKPFSVFVIVFGHLRRVSAGHTRFGGRASRTGWLQARIAVGPCLTISCGFFDERVMMFYKYLHVVVLSPIEQQATVDMYAVVHTQLCIRTFR